MTFSGEVAQAIVGEIRVTVTPQDQARLTAARPVNPEAYDAYLKGRYFWNRWGYRLLEKAVEHFQRAIDKDPTYAPAYAGLALCYDSLGFWHSQKEVFPKAKAAATKALDIDEAQSEAHTALGYMKVLFEWDWPGAEREFRRALELNPKSAEADFHYASYLTMMGRFDEAIGVAKQGLTIDPLSLAMNSEMAWVYTNARRYDEAIEQYKRILELDPNYSHGRYFFGGLLHVEGEA